MLSPSLTIKNVIVAIQLLYIANNHKKIEMIPPAALFKRAER
jgi:hypothetical protein